MRRMHYSVHRTLCLLCLLLAGGPAAHAFDDNWTVVTMAHDGSWGVSCQSTQPHAIAEAIRFCQAIAGGPSDCGAQLAVVRGGWIVANLCGEHPILASGHSLLEAEQDALNREISLQMLYVPDLPPCRRVLAVGPQYTIASQLQYSWSKHGHH